MPPAMKVEPHSFQFKPGAKPVREPRPHFGKAKEQYLENWKDWALKVGLITPAPLAKYASRLHIAAKYKSNKAKGLIPDGLRPCWAGVRINDTLLKTVPTYPNPMAQLYKAARYKYKFSADGLKQYWSIPLTQESKEVTAFWLPSGLYKFERLIMGTKNAATVTQNAYTDAMQKHLSVRPEIIL